MKKLTLTVLMALITTLMYAVEPSGTIPVVYINIPDHDLNYVHNNKDTYVSAEMWIVDPAGTYTTGSAESPMTFQMKGRGNYTWSGFDKKPYRVKFDSKQGVLGMNKSKHFGLLAQADDNRGFTRNALGFKVSETVGLSWTPSQVPCELVINNEYRGLYFFTELIKNAKDRVNVSDGYEKSAVEADTEGTIPADYYTGGWIIEIDNYDTSPHVTVVEPNSDNYQVWLTYDKMIDEATEAQENFLIDQFTTIQNLIYGDKDNDDALWELLDLDAAAKFYVVQEFTDNYESYHGSCYLWRERGADEKWYFGPVWDFGSSMYETTKSTTIAQDRPWHQVWIAELLKHPKFKARAVEIYNSLMESVPDIKSYITDFCSNISSAAERDYQLWPSYGNTNLTSKANDAVSFITSTTTWAKQQGLVTETSSDDDGNVVIYYNNPNEWNPVYCYIYTDHGQNHNWPGEEMTDLGNGWWSYVVPEDYQYGYAMFANAEGNAQYPGHNEAGLAINGTTHNLNDTTWTEGAPDFGGTTEPETPEEPEVIDYTVYFFDAVGAWPQVYVWIWEDADGWKNYTGGNWPGEAMTRKQDKTRAAITSASVTWQHTINTDDDLTGKTLKVVFSGYDGNGTSDSNKLGQTDDLEYTPGNTYASDGTSTGAVEITLSKNSFKAFGGNGAIALTTDADTEVVISTIDGRSRAVTAHTGVTVIPCTTGVYVVRTANTTAKVIVK